MRKVLLVSIFFISGSLLFKVQAQNTWLNKAPYGGGPRDVASGFAIGNTGYILSGTDTGSYFMDMWAWNSASNIWSEVASYPGGDRIGTRSISLNGFGYVLGGEHPSNCFLMPGGGVCAGTFYSDVWRYNPDLNIWTIDSAFPGTARNYAVAVADPADSTIYYGTGNNNGSSFLSDWWAFYAPTHTWTQLADFPGGQRDFAVGFYANGAIYVGTGDDGDTTIIATNDFWKYTPSSNSWARISNVPGMPLRCASAFSIGNYGYVCLGLNGNSNYTSGGWRYNTLNDTWNPIASYGGGMMADGVAFTIDSNGYVGTGAYNAVTYSQFWEYTFDNSSSLGVSNEVETPLINIYPNPTKNIINIAFSGINSIPAKLTLVDISGNLINSYSINPTEGQATLNLSNLSSGIYFYQITGAAEKPIAAGKLIVTK